jgi:hypothetical protein
VRVAYRLDVMRFRLLSIERECLVLVSQRLVSVRLAELRQGWGDNIATVRGLSIERARLVSVCRFIPAHACRVLVPEQNINT